jgi:Asp-tRNA(Asn)/Glu-tRNA(Gln) amidotransferase A subunit family amidase
MNARDVITPPMRPFLPATADFVGGTDSPREFLKRCIAELDTWEPKIGAFVTVNVAAAREAADRSTERWRAGKPLSPIDGVPIGVKDIIETIDMPTEYGSPLFLGFRSERDSASVAALREAGAVILGKTVTTEFGLTEPLGTHNPWDPYAGGLQQRFCRGGRHGRDQRRAWHASARLDIAAGEFLRLLRLQADVRSDQPRREL